MNFNVLQKCLQKSKLFGHKIESRLELAVVVHFVHVDSEIFFH